MKPVGTSRGKDPHWNPLLDRVAAVSKSPLRVTERRLPGSCRLSPPALGSSADIARLQEFSTGAKRVAVLQNQGI